MRKKPEAYRWFRAYFAQRVLSEQDSERFGLQPDQAARFAELSERAAEAIHRAGYRVHGDLDDLRPALDGSVPRTPDDVSAAEMLDVSAVAIDRLLHDVRALTLERDALRRRARSAEHPQRGSRSGSRGSARTVARAVEHRGRVLVARIRQGLGRDQG